MKLVDAAFDSSELNFKKAPKARHDGSKIG